METQDAQPFATGLLSQGEDFPGPDDNPPTVIAAKAAIPLAQLRGGTKRGPGLRRGDG